MRRRGPSTPASGPCTRSRSRPEPSLAASWHGRRGFRGRDKPDDRIVSGDRDSRDRRRCSVKANRITRLISVHHAPPAGPARCRTGRAPVASAQAGAGDAHARVLGRRCVVLQRDVEGHVGGGPRQREVELGRRAGRRRSCRWASSDRSRPPGSTRCSGGPRGPRGRPWSRTTTWAAGASAATTSSVPWTAPSADVTSTRASRPPSPVVARARTSASTATARHRPGPAPHAGAARRAASAVAAAAVPVERPPPRARGRAGRRAARRGGGRARAARTRRPAAAGRAARRSRQVRLDGRESAQALQGQPDASLDGAERHAQALRDLAVRQPSKKASCRLSSCAGGSAAMASASRCARSATPAKSAGSGPPRRRRAPDTRPRARSPAAIDGAVAGHGQQPRREAGARGVVVGRSAPEGDERVLRALLGGARVARDRERHAVDQAAEAGVGMAERGGSPAAMAAASDPSCSSAGAPRRLREQHPVDDVHRSVDASTSP